MAKELIAVHGCNIKCSLTGTTSAILNVLTSKAKIESKNVAVVSDKLFIPSAVTFGTCPNLGPGPCVPVLPGNWSDGCTNNKLDNTFILKEISTLSCTVGGTISITNTGQTTVLAN